MTGGFVLPTVLACLGFGVGTAMMKHGMATQFPEVSLARLWKEGRSIASAVLRNRVWAVGALVNLAGGVFQVMALSRGDITLVQPLVNMNIVLTVAAGVVWMGERISRREAAGVGVVVAGAVLLGLSATAASTPRVDRPALWGIAAGALVLCAALALALRPRRALLSAEVGLALMAGILFGVGFAYVKVAAIEAAAFVEAARPAAAGLVSFLLREPAVWVLAATSLLGFVVMQGAFSHGRVAVVSPITTICAILVPVVAGVFAFHEAVGPLRGSGIAAVVLGTALLAA